MTAFFADTIAASGDAVALVDETAASLSYADLAARADEVARRIGPTPRLVLLEAQNNVDSVVALLACLRGRHPVIIAAEAARQRTEANFQPNLIISGDGGHDVRHARDLDLHPDLAVMLSTSGSTGATKLVRLSRTAVDANARAIADYLAIGTADRAVTTLPVSYSYGLSVLNSHLAAGASVVLTNRSVVDDALWALVEATQATSLAGVPYTYELLEATGFRNRSHPSLRTLTQAGGRLSPELVSTYADWAHAHGARFFTMYGQTEATARMAYLPPELLDGHSDCIGKAIPGGELAVVDDTGRAVAIGEVGELVYTGPNVMMGYAEGVADLARGAELAELRTGDLGQEVEDGLFRVVGRTSRFSKIAGLRVGLDEIERMLAAANIGSVVAGDDQLVAIGVARFADVAAAERIVDDKTAIPLRSRVVFALGETPRLASGKVDFPTVLANGRAAFAAAENQAAAADASEGERLAALYARALSRRSVATSDSFASLHGDSLAYVEVSMAIERELGHLPDNWERLTIDQVTTMAAASPPAGRKSRSVATEMLIRPLAMTTIIVGHALVGHSVNLLWKGGALTLLMTAGYNAARFQRDQLISPRRVDLIGQFAVRYLIPYFLFIGLYKMLASKAHIGVSTLFMLGNYLDHRGTVEVYWFMEALFQCLVVLVVLFSIPPVRRFAIEQRWLFGLCLVVATTALNFGIPLIAADEFVNGRLHRTDTWAYAFALGWLMTEANTTAKRIACVVGAALLSGFDWGFVDSHTAFLMLATAVILFVPRINLATWLAVALAFISQTTFYIYLSHGIVINIVRFRLHIFNVPLMVVLSLLLGIVVFLAWRRVVALATTALNRARGRRAAPERDTVAA